jgi:imidazolonepropionase-like amidohydrolase
MSHRLFALTLAALLLVADVAGRGQAPGPPGQRSAPAVTLIRAGRVVDVRAGRLLTDQGILIEGDRIKAVGPYAQVLGDAPQGARAIDLSGATVLPGLIDCHTHLLMADDMRDLVQMSTAERALLGAATARQALGAGVTTVRDLGNSGTGGDVALRNGILAGWVSGPRIIASTRALSPFGGQFDSMRSSVAAPLIAQEYVAVSGPAEAQRAVDQAVFAGADIIKVIVDTGVRENYTSVLDEATLRAIVERAHRSRLKVAAHAVMNAAVQAAAHAGVDSIEHAYFASDENLRLMHDNGIYLVPTDSEQPTAFYVDRLKRALKLGVKIAFGSDARGLEPNHAANAKTFKERSIGTLIGYQKAGMTPIDIIRAATIDAAALVGWDDPPGSLEAIERTWIVDEAKDWRNRLGSVEAGRFADLIAVAGDPLRDLGELMRIDFVMKGGELVPGK